MRQITCEESDEIRPNLTPYASCTNYIGGKVINPPPFPPHTRTEWCDEDEVVRLVETNSAEGCVHEVPEAEDDA